jgi:hypothetical protein
VKKLWLATVEKFGSLAYLLVGLILGGILLGGVAVAQSVTVVEQGKGGRYGSWLMGGNTAGGTLTPIRVDSSGNLSVVVGSGAAANGLRVQSCAAPVAYQLTTTKTAIPSPVDAGAWKLRVQNLGNDEVLLSTNPTPTEANSHRIQAGGDWWEIDWVGAAYIVLKATAATSPQVTPEDTRVTVCYY